MQGEAAIRVLHGKIALNVAPLTVRPTPPVRLDKPLGITFPRLQRNFTAQIRLKAGDITPNCAREVGIRCSDDNFTLLLIIGHPIPHIPALVGLGYPYITGHPRQRVRMCIGAEREVVIPIEVGPHNPTMLGRPV